MSNPGLIIIDDPDTRPLSADARQRVLAWMDKTMPAKYRGVRAIRYVKIGALVAFDRDISDRKYPDIEQMLLDCGHSLG